MRHNFARTLLLLFTCISHHHERLSLATPARTKALPIPLHFPCIHPSFRPPCASTPSARRSGNRATSFVGTAEYVSPEVLNNTGITYASDLWALGCIIYQLLAGRPPFKGVSEYLTFQLITSREFEFPANFPPAARDLVDKLLREVPAERIGAGDIGEIKRHPFFAGVDWAAGARAAPAPRVAPVRVQSQEEVALDWELSSLFRSQAHGPVYYEYLPAAGAAGTPQRA